MLRWLRLSPSARRYAKPCIDGFFIALAAFALSAGTVDAQSSRWKIKADSVLDRKTNLTWRRCFAGQVAVGPHCKGSPRHYTWDEAAGLTSGGWRLPTPDELVSLVDEDRKRRGLVPTFDTAAFPGADPTIVLDTWTAYRRDCEGHSCGLVVGFGFAKGGDVFDQPVDLPLVVRLVRGTASPAGAPEAGDHDAPAKVTADGRFELRGNLARDRRTGLVWQRCDAGRRMTAELGCAGTVHSYAMDEALHLGHDGWRLPTLDELVQLVDPIRKDKGLAPYMDQEAFPAGPHEISDYWTSTHYTAAGDQLYCVNFHLGTPDNCGPYRQGVRLVRSGS